jgi:methyl-galactoside transport system substrate-binding protein
VECITAANDAMALGALQSVEAAGYNEKGEESDKYVPIFGIDALPETLTKIESGEIAGSVLQDAKTQGETIVKIADNLINGKEALDGTDLEFDTDGSKAVRIPYQAISKDTLQIAEDSYK